MRIFAAVGLLVLASLAAPAVAQEGEVIVVTGQRVASDDEYEQGMGDLPYISIKVPADFVMFTVRLESPTINAVERRTELGRAYRALTQRVGRTAGVKMEIGEPGYSTSPETATAEEIIESDGRRSYIPLLLTFEARAGETFAQVRDRAEAFIDGIEVNGRVEAVTGDEQYIGVRDPAKHRADLLRRIADDTRQMQEIFAITGAQGIALTGLGGRVKSRPIGPMEIEMFIPYSIVLGAPLLR